MTDSGLVDMLLGLSISIFHISIASEFTSCYSSQILFSTHDKSLVFKVDLLNFSTCNTKHNFFNVLKEVYWSNAVKSDYSSFSVILAKIKLNQKEKSSLPYHISVALLLYSCSTILHCILSQIVTHCYIFLHCRNFNKNQYYTTRIFWVDIDFWAIKISSSMIVLF